MGVSGESLHPGTVVLVRLAKDTARPAVVMRSAALPDLSHATVLPIATELYPNLSFRIDISPTAENGLRQASQIMVDWPQTVYLADMGGTIGQLDARTLRAVSQELAMMLGIGASQGRRTAG